MSSENQWLEDAFHIFHTKIVPFWGDMLVFRDMFVCFSILPPCRCWIFGKRLVVGASIRPATLVAQKMCRF